MRPPPDHATDKVERGIDLKRLRYFIAVCDHGGISKAASAIGIAQPALTRQIKILEAQIGLPLINRSGRGVEPSRPGRYILDRSREHINSLDGLLSSVRAAFPVAQEPFVLGVCPSLAPLLRHEVMDLIRGDHPRIALSVVEATCADLKSLLACGHLDMALTYRSGSLEEGVFTELLTERFQLVRTWNRSESGRRWSLKDVAGARLVLPSRLNEARIVIDRIFEDHRIRLEPRVELDSIDSILLILQQEDAEHASILPAFSVDQSTEKRALHREEIDEPALQRTIGIAAPGAPRNPDAFALVSIQVREAVSMLGSSATVSDIG